MRLLVFGASGRTGREVLRQSIEHGHVVTAFVRRSAGLAVAGAAIRVVAGNVRDPAPVASAMPDHDAVVCVLGSGRPLRHDPDVIAGVGNIINAMQQHGIRRLIHLSFIGVGESRSAVGWVLRYVAPLPLKHEIADHEAKEALVRASSLDWTIVRPPRLTSGPRTGNYRVGENISTWNPLPGVSRADVADFILRELAHPAYVRRVARLLH